MIYALILLASLANAQEVSTGAATSLLDEVRISNIGKDTRDLLSGRYRQTGKPTFANGFCFADGTCQTTAPTATGDMSKSAENEMTATGSIVLTNGSYIATNKNDGLMIDLSGGNVVFAVSADGATQSSGCVVAVTMYAGAAGSDGAPSNVARFTSTTTANLDLANASSFGPSRPGVLLESCAPGAFCKVGMRGIFRAVATNTGYSPTGSIVLNFSATRCKPVGAGTPPSISTIIGHFMSPTDAQGNFWLSVGP